MLFQLTLLHLPTSLPSASPTLQSHFSKFTSNPTQPTYIYTQIEDPTYIYLLQQSTPEQQNTKEFTHPEGVALEWTLRIEINDATQTDYAEAPLPLNAPVMAIGRYFVATGKKAGYQETFDATRGHLERFTAPLPLAGGWRIDQCSRGEEEGEGKEEYVLFSGWDAVERHFAFAETEGFKEFVKIKSFLEGAEIKHALRWEGVGR
ncbi:hypothetical protein BO94DRAFT_577135 [Aspergillus sclerotioniger CBS 115572]|uniref:ABM domain-containing protein n=1 Tax=Aspergillus sclerotioniger CBS 115572 TaxID=1450535 RepID=A0A317W0N4_9EURO|nr:hypothetical protein BO94DRAFT_577135 [Aspergillus sclerotioniger CBS 115572]PWY79459.1 hypothetical protein BO94DRAFT_577135 [Aspergillus sclerotioniger CBS 115572]